MPTVQTDELRTLTDSINGNANVARTVIALLLLLALYLFLTLAASTDRNLLLDGQVLLPQLGVGLAVSTSYVLAPPVFIYLHLHAMMALATLARQMRTYDTLVRAGGGRSSAPNPPPVELALRLPVHSDVRAQCRNYPGFKINRLAHGRRASPPPAGRHRRLVPTLSVMVDYAVPPLNPCS